MAQNLATRTIYPSAARIATPSVSILRNTRNTGIQVIIDVTAVAATPEITIEVEARDQLTGKWYSLGSSAAISTVSTTVLRVEKGNTVAANVASAAVPRVYRITSTHLDADSITYSVGANLVI